MYKIYYTSNEDAIVISDFDAEQCVEDYIYTFGNAPKEEINIKFANELPLIIFSLAVLERKINPDHIEFYYNNTKIPFDPICGLEDFGSPYLKVNEKCVKVSYELIKKENKEKENI